MRSFRFVLALGVALALPACAGQAASQQAATPETEDQKTLYAVGLAIAQNLGQFNLSESDLAMVQAGISDSVLKREAKVNLQEYGPKIQALMQGRAAAVAAAEAKASEEFVAKQATEPGAQKSESGLVYFEIQPGTGESPKATDTVTVHYTGTLRDGSKFDSSVDRGQPASFRLDGVIKCWTEGVQKMKVGGKAKLVCPSALAYGERGAGGRIPGNAALVFEVELLKIEAEKTDAAATEPQ